MGRGVHLVLDFLVLVEEEILLVYLFLLMVEEHGPLVACLFVCIFDDGGGPFVGLAEDGLLHLLDSFFDVASYH